MRMVLSVCFSAVLVCAFVLVAWVIGIIGQSPGIPVQTPDVSYFEIILHQKKRNPINDHYPLAPPVSTNSSSEPIPHPW